MSAEHHRTIAIGLAVSAILLSSPSAPAQQTNAKATAIMAKTSTSSPEALAVLKKGMESYVERSYAEARTNFLAAADMDCIEAQSMLGVLYDNGFGVERDYAEAMKWFTLAAKKDYPPAMFGIGVLHRDGRGVTKDYKVAAEWIRKAAEKGYDEAQFNLGVMHLYGHGVSQDYNESAKWWRLSAAQGNSNAKRNLDLLISRGMIKQ